MKRKSATSVTISPKLRCQRIYPVQGTKKTVGELKTVGFKLTRDQAINLARVLLAVSQNWKAIDVTAFRSKEFTDGTFPITVTTVD
ncbi:MAG TPA: hypothetical protein VFB23_02300 [Candidatus Acidoferrales bacterium]|jgi:hypothetical protein|nr:hypothetical protein [Candidatus Acidoferrales bacterium]